MRYAPEFKKSPSNPLKKFAVCDIPLYDTCAYNASRDDCHRLGCCFRKGVCYEKSVPDYVQVFLALIVIVAGAFIIIVVYRVVRDRREKEDCTKSPSSCDKVEADPFSAEPKARTPGAGPSAEREGRGATVIIKNDEEIDHWNV